MNWALEIIISSLIWINYIVIQFVSLLFLEQYLEYYVTVELYNSKFTFIILLFVTHPDWEKQHVNVRYEKITKPTTKLVIVFNVTLIRDLSQFLYWDVLKKCDAMRYVSESRNKTYLISFIADGKPSFRLRLSIFPYRLHWLRAYFAVIILFINGVGSGRGIQKS